MGKKISELQESEQISNADYLVAVINGQTNKMKYQSFLKKVREDQKRIYNLTIDTEWNADTDVFKKVITVEGIAETDIVKIYPVWSDDLETRLLEKEQYNKISVVHSQNGGIELICDEDKPNTNLNVRLEAM